MEGRAARGSRASLDCPEVGGISGSLRGAENTNRGQLQPPLESLWSESRRPAQQNMPWGASRRDCPSTWGGGKLNRGLRGSAPEGRVEWAPPPPSSSRRGPVPGSEEQPCLCPFQMPPSCQQGHTPPRLPRTPERSDTWQSHRGVQGWAVALGTERAWPRPLQKRLHSKEAKAGGGGSKMGQAQEGSVKGASPGEPQKQSQPRSLRTTRTPTPRSASGSLGQGLL